jgi:hypothetical protein
LIAINHSSALGFDVFSYEFPVDFQAEADINQDGVVDLLKLQPLVDLLRV